MKAVSWLLGKPREPWSLYPPMHEPCTSRTMPTRGPLMEERIERRVNPRDGEQSRPFLTAQWRNLVMLHWEVDPALLIDRVPTGTTLDLWQSKAYVGLIGFQFLDTRVLGAPVLFHQDFEEVNLRFYVRHVVDEEVRNGVVLICECVPRQMVGGMARLLYREPYVVLPMKSSIQPGPPAEVEFAWQTPPHLERLARAGRAARCRSLQPLRRRAGARAHDPGLCPGGGRLRGHDPLAYAPRLTSTGARPG